MFWSPHHFYTGGSYGFWGTPSLLSILFFIGIIILFFSLFRKSSDEEKDESGKEETALDILKKRYAKGEITKRQYLEMKKDIG